MKMSKKVKQKKNRFQRFVNFLKRFPTLIVLSIIIPTLITTMRYIGTLEYYYNNLSFSGQDWAVNAETFELTGIRKRTSVFQTSSLFSYQGGVCYQNYYVICADSFESIIIYDTERLEKGPIHIVSTNMIVSDWHCNQIFFGTEFYAAHDKFPLLYVCMEHPGVLATYVFRIYQLGIDYQVSQIQKIQLVFDDDKGPLYFPNAYIDFQKESILYGGYTKNSYMREDDNYLRYYRFDIPDYRILDVEFATSKATEVFELPSETATQGGFINGSYFYQTFAFGSKTDPLRTPKLRIVNLDTHKIIKQYDNLYESFGVAEEFEHLAVDLRGRLFSLGNPFTIYEFDYKFSTN